MSLWENEIFKLTRFKKRVDQGNLVCAAGFDLILKGEDPATLTAERVKERLEEFVLTAKREREKAMPALKDIASLSDEDFLKVMPHYCSIDPQA